MKIHLKNLKVTEVKQGSAIFTGDNAPMGWEHTKKVNDGFGSLDGNHNEFMNSQHVVTKHMTNNKQKDKTNDIPPKS